MLELDKTIRITEAVTNSPNLCDRLAQEDLDHIGRLVWEGYQRDDQSREKWKVWNEAASRGGNDCFGEPVVNFRAYLAARAASDRSRKSERKTYSGSRGVIAKHTADSWK